MEDVKDLFVPYEFADEAVAIGLPAVLKNIPIKEGRTSPLFYWEEVRDFKKVWLSLEIEDLPRVASWPVQYRNEVLWLGTSEIPWLPDVCGGHIQNDVAVLLRALAIAYLEGDLSLS
jgi:hypothetical protein